jgi:ribulokinase
MAGGYVIGVDGGTEGLRAAVFDLQGAVRGMGVATYPTRFPAPAQAEQDPEDWWRAMGEAVPAALAQAGIAADQVDALSVDTTCCSVVALDRAGRALRPALIWMDVRAAAQAAKVAASGDRALKVNSAGAGPVSAEWMIPKALWLKENEPRVFDAAALVGEYQDFITLRLTGRWVGSINTASIRWHHDNRNGGHPRSLLEALGLSALLEKWPSEILPLGEVVGPLTPDAAAHLGLKPGTPVAQGGPDAFVGMIGLGVVTPGKLAFITGSSHLLLGLSPTALHGRGIWGSYPDAVVPGLHVVEGGQTSTGSVIAWLKRLFGEGASYDQLNQEAAALPPGAEGLLMLDHFQGNRTPYTDPASRGAITGLSLKHGPAHIFRAAIEGIAFGSELILDAMRANGFAPSEVVICGGATRSPLWLQTHADVSGVPLQVTRVPEAPLLGSGMLAALGAGHFTDMAEVAAAMVQPERVVEPDPGRHAAYREIYARYQQLYPALAPLRTPSQTI